MSGTVTPDPGPLLIELRPSGIEVAGESPKPPGLLQLRGLIARKLEGRWRAIVRGSADTDGEALAMLLKAARGTALETLHLESGSYRAEITVRSPGAADVEWLFLYLDGERPELGFSSGETPNSPAQRAFTPGDPGSEREIADWLEPRCTGKSCWIELRLKPELKLARLAPVLDALRRVHASGPALVLSVRGRDEDLGPRKVKLGATAVSGRLPPEEIQRVVRRTFGSFRKCYESGLARDANLQGKVVARFVIGRDGKVSNVTDGGSEIADAAVRDCVLQAFYQLEFPAPEGGIVTVVYPIVFAPAEAP